MSTICWIFDSLWVRLLEVIPPFDHFAGCTKAYMCDHLSRVFPDAWQASKKLSITTTPEADLKFVRAVLTLYQNATPARQDVDGFGWIWMGDSEDVRSSQSTSIQQPTTNYPIYPTTTTNNQFIQQPNLLVSIAKNVGFPHILLSSLSEALKGRRWPRRCGEDFTRRVSEPSNRRNDGGGGEKVVLQIRGFFSKPRKVCKSGFLGPTWLASLAAVFFLGGCWCLGQNDS